MPYRKYYSAKRGTAPNQPVMDLLLLKQLFRAIYLQFAERGYFDECFGSYCVDSGRKAGKLGTDVPLAVFRALRKPDLWPPTETIDNYSEEDLFDVIEFIHDHTSKPVESWHHNWNECGLHHEKFDAELGRVDFRAELNEVLADYQNGFELTPDGEILEIGEPGLDHLLKAEIPETGRQLVDDKIREAVRQFRRHHASLEDRRQAVRLLVDAFEALRPELEKVVTSKDEGELFNIANNFGIRHNNDQQKTAYDQSLWLSWMFYHYLSTIHVVLRRLAKVASSSQVPVMKAAGS